MPSVFDLLDEIEKRPEMYIGWSPDQRREQMLHLETLLMGYGHAIERHGIKEPCGDFFASFSGFLREKCHWDLSCGFMAAIREHTGDDEEAWQELWRLIHEFRATVAK